MKKLLIALLVLGMFGFGSVMAHPPHGGYHRGSHEVQHAYRTPHRTVMVHPRRRMDVHVWHSGNWYHTVHGGVMGWWFLAGGIWYLYSQPTYPYPDPNVPAGVSGPAPQNFWYYCPTSREYYPYVTACAVAWEQVPAQPQGN